MVSYTTNKSKKNRPNTKTSEQINVFSYKITKWGEYSVNIYLVYNKLSAGFMYFEIMKLLYPFLNLKKRLQICIIYSNKLEMNYVQLNFST